VVAAHPDVVTVAEYAGAAFLIGYGALAARRAFKPGALTPSDAAPARLTGVLATCLALTFLNPHVYLDTVVLLGALANEHHDGRWLFGVGAVTACAVWFTGLGFGARRLRPLFESPRTWRLLDGGIAAVMIALGLTLAVR
jgi:L-lysine exporter family protein LysE/ArgO